VFWIIQLEDRQGQESLRYYSFHFPHFRAQRENVENEMNNKEGRKRGKAAHDHIKMFGTLTY
jgi:hypothetical protein